MSNCKCGKKSCNKCCGSSSSSSASTDAFLAQLQDQLQEVLAETKFLKGHPFIGIEDPEDIASFDMSSGEGFDNWEGWAICDGQPHTSTKNKIVTTPNFTDRFVVMAGNDYSVGDTGGLKEVTLVESELPSHDHSITDPGHVHVLTDPGHTHGATSGSHTHTFTGVAHTHVVADAGIHQHRFTMVGAYSYSTGAAAPAVAQVDLGTNYDMLTDNAGEHDHDLSSTTATGSNSSEVVGVTVASAFTGISVQSHATGITQTNDTGDDHAHENRPPYYAVLFVKWIG